MTNVPQVGNKDDEEIDFGADSKVISTQEANQEENVRIVDEQHTDEEINITWFIESKIQLSF